MKTEKSSYEFRLTKPLSFIFAQMIAKFHSYDVVQIELTSYF